MYTMNLLGIAQNVKQDLMKINEVYSTITNLSMEINYSVFSSAQSNVALETHTGIFKQHDGMFYSRLKEVESLHNKNCSVVIDNEDKMIVVANPTKSDVSKITLIDMDKSLKTCSSVETIVSKGNQAGYKFVYKQNVVSEYDAIELYFNKKTFLIEKMVMYYRQKQNLKENEPDAIKEKPRLEIVFFNTNLKTVTDVSFFSEARFVEKRKGKYFPVNAYNQYQLIDQKFAE
jgi:hypothetical protein